MDVKTRIGSDRIGSDRIGPDRTGSDRTESDNPDGIMVIPKLQSSTSEMTKEELRILIKEFKRIELLLLMMMMMMSLINHKIKKIHILCYINENCVSLRL